MSIDTMSLVRKHAFVISLQVGMRRCGVESGDRLVLAVSGGADSTALLLGMAAIAPQEPWQLDLHVAHVNHHLRDEADDDAAFVAALSKKYDLPCHLCDVHPQARPGNLEAVARRMRYETLQSIAAKVDADAVVTAHHADDQLETVLMRLIRGASVRGMAAMAPRRALGPTALIRPMLAMRGDYPHDLLEAVGQTWREDSTNAQLDRMRARLRADVLPVLAELRVDAATKAGHTANQMRQAQRVLGRLERAACKEHVCQEDSRLAITRQALRGLDAIIATGVVRRIARRAGVPGDRLGSNLVGQITKAATDGQNSRRQFDLANGCVAAVDASTLTIGPASGGN